MKPEISKQQSEKRLLGTDKLQAAACGLRTSLLTRNQGLRTRDQGPGTRDRAAFTIAELMVAMLILIMILGMTAMVYQSSSKAMKNSNATSELYQTAEAIRKQLQYDISSITKDGYLVIGKRTYTNLNEVNAVNQIQWSNLYTGSGSDPDKTSAHADYIYFISVSQFKANMDTDAVSNIARVIYTHANSVLPLSYGESFTTTNINRWILTRRARLFIPNYAGVANPREVITQSLGKELSDFPNNFTPILTTDINFSSLSPQDTFTCFAANCGTFKIRYSTDNQQTWNYPNPDPTPTVFPIGGIGWPTHIEFTIRLYDRNLTIKSIDKDLGREHGGQTFSFIIGIGN